MNTGMTFKAFQEALEIKNPFTDFVNDYGPEEARKAFMAFKNSGCYTLIEKFLEQIERSAFLNLRTTFPKESEKIATYQAYAFFREAFIDFVGKMCEENTTEEMQTKLLMKRPTGTDAI